MATFTNGMRRALREMAVAESEDRFEDAEIVCDGGECWLGERQVARRTVRGLLNLLAIKEDGYGGGAEHFCLQDIGRALLRRPALADEVEYAVLAGRRFMVDKNHQLQYL